MINRNAPCPCGSGKKYKKCCINKAAAATPDAAKTLQLAASLERSGQFDQAAAQYETLLTQNPANDRCRWALGKLQLRIGKPESGLDHMDQVIVRQIKNASAVSEFCNLLTEHGNTDRAMLLLDKALKHNSADPNLLLAKGNILEKTNHRPEAIAILQKALASAPQDPAVITPLARSYRHEKHYDKAEKLLLACIDTITTATPPMSALWSELGMVQDKLGKFDKAFSAFTRAGELTLARKDVLALDDTIRDREIEQQQQWITGGGLDRAARADIHADIEHVFFVGMPRSGTTLTEQIMSSHSKISSSEEKLFLWEATKKLQELYGQQNALETILSTCDSKALNAASAAYWQGVQPHLTAESGVFVDKLPMNIISLGLINMVFPKAKIMVALRDPRDVCLSCFFQSFSINLSMKKFMDWSTTSAYYNKVMTYWLAVRSRIDLPWIEVRYEDTVEDLQGQAEKIFRHLGVEWEDAVLKHHELSQNKYVATPSYEAIREPVHKRAMQRWKNYPLATAAAEGDLQRFISEFAYTESGG